MSDEYRDHYRKAFEAAHAGGTATAEGPDWLDPIRRGAMDRFSELGLPTSHDEEWRFTPVAPLARTEFLPAPPAELTAADLAGFAFGHPEWPRLVFVNGYFAPALSSVAELPAGVQVSALSEAFQGDGAWLEQNLTRHVPVDATAFTALNTAFLTEGAVVHVAAGVELDRPVHLLYVTTGAAAGAVTHPRNLIVVERQARASVIESYVTLAPGSTYFTNAVTEVFSGENAWTEHTRIQRESEQAYHVGLTHVEQQRDSHYRSFTLAMGAAMSRHNLNVQLNAPNIETLMYGLYLTRGEQVADNHTTIFHSHPQCNSWEVYKGVLDGNSRGVFNGKVFVTPEAQQTDAKQTNRNLLLSDGARVDTKPQLEIFADDVKCTHGATVGRLDHQAVFYLRSRGVPDDEAQRLLTYAFAAEVVDEVALEPVRQELDRLVHARLNGED
ncbi:MAG TPA: Fe-S cluster assembly protein SufD [Gemmatimonadales bacterium]|nr:Fe-S cluster assembly protein SufD [Gemmatimonadales bacterium]